MAASNFLLLTAIVTVGYQLVFFLATALLRFDKLTDIAGCTNFVILATLTLYLKGAFHFGQVVLSALVAVWGLRLGLFLLMRILQWGEDHRFDKIRNNLPKLAVFWFFQAAWVWTVSLPVTMVNASDINSSIKVQELLVGLCGSWGFSSKQLLTSRSFCSRVLQATEESGVMWVFGGILATQITSGRYCFGGEYLWHPLQFSLELNGL